jgi:hypothetical protein
MRRLYIRQLHVGFEPTGPQDREKPSNSEKSLNTKKALRLILSLVLNYDN